MRSHLRPSPYNKRSQRKAALAKQPATESARSEQRQYGDDAPDPGQEPSRPRTRPR